jgi:hypothetical protein
MTITEKPTGIMGLMLAGWLGRLPSTVWRMSEQPSEGHPEGRMRKLTLLDHAVWGFGGAAAGRGTGRAGRQRQVARSQDTGGERRHLFGAGKGPAEAGAKQESIVLMDKGSTCAC